MAEKTITKVKKRSKKYRSNLETVNKALDGREKLEVSEAVELLMNFEQPKFEKGATLEIHFKLNINPTKSDQIIRSSMTLPNGTGKDIKIAAFVTPENEKKAKDAGASVVGGEDLIDKIKNAGKIDFDIAIAEPEMMKKLPAIARILGTAGVMPSPKNQTVGTNIDEMIAIIKAGKIDLKNDKTGNLHLICGKINKEFTKEKLVENVEAVIDTVQKAKPEGVKKKLIHSVHLTTTLSPSIRII